MKRTKDAHDHTLESSRLFPFIAWILIIFFCVFVYGITMNLRSAAAELRIKTDISETMPTKNERIRAPQENNQ